MVHRSNLEREFSPVNPSVEGVRILKIIQVFIIDTGIPTIIRKVPT